jgi:hypothetical protein
MLQNEEKQTRGGGNFREEVKLQQVNKYFQL